MSLLQADVTDARAVLDEDAGQFVLQIRLANGRELRFSTSPSDEQLVELRDALTAEPEPEKKPTRRRRARKSQESSD